MAVGPSLTFASKFELQNKSWKTPGVLANAGCHVSIITDNSVIPQHICRSAQAWRSRPAWTRSTR